MFQKTPWAVMMAMLFATSLLTGSISQAGTTGKLVGKVTNEKKEPLAGVNVRIEAQRVGAVTNENGEYFIIGVLGGTYLVRANLLGYAAFAANNVTITPDFTTELNIELKGEAVQMQEVRVEAERPLLQKDATGTTRFLSSEDIQKMPTRGYRDAAAQQTGVVNFQKNIDNEAQNAPTLIIRGGRPNETAYFVDGFSQQDPLTGTSSTSISNSAIEEVVMMTGGFAPEYGRIMSGAVNVITREGGDKYFGSLEAISDVLAGDWIKAPKTDYNLYDFSLGGPVIPGKEDLSFYVSSERRWQRDRSPSFMPSQFEQELERQGLDPDFKPTNTSSGYTFQGKLAWQLGKDNQLKVGGIGSNDQWRQYQNAYLFNLDHAPRYEDQNQSYFATFNHLFNARTYANLGINFFETLRKRGDGVFFDDIGGYYVDGGNILFDQDIPVFWDPGHVFDDYLQRRSSYWGVQGSATSQINPYHQLKAGGDLQLHTLRLFNHFFPTNLGGSNPDVDNWDGYGYTIGFDDNGKAQLEQVDDGPDGPKHPKTWSLFAQDKYERSGVIVNAGLRFDHINVDTPALLSERFPLGDPDAVGNPDSLETGDLESNKTYARLSPRLGVAFPVDDKTVLRVNYGQFYQQPNLQDLYVNYRFLEYKVKTGGYFVGFGNPNLRPERTSAYEVGVQRQVGDRVRLDATAYYKDVKDLVEITNIPSSPKSFSSYRNRDFATIKGVDLGIAMRPINHISGQISYSLSFAQGTGSVSNTQRNIAWVGTETPKQTVPLDFDQRHKLSMNLDYRLGKGEGPKWSGRNLLENFGVNALFNVGSGTPYTPTKVYNEVTLAAVSSEPEGPLNSRYGPWTVNLDLKISKAFDLSGFRMEAFLWGLNVFDNRNPIAVYTSTGTPVSTNWLNTDDGQAFLANTGSQGAYLYDLATNNPNLYGNPRLVRFGLRTSF
jgi:outer membrane receptor protein involved in Fe transport